MKLYIKNSDAVFCRWAANATSLKDIWWCTFLQRRTLFYR